MKEKSGIRHVPIPANDAERPRVSDYESRRREMAFANSAHAGRIAGRVAQPRHAPLGNPLPIQRDETMLGDDASRAEARHDISAALLAQFLSDSQATGGKLLSPAGPLAVATASRPDATVELALNDDYRLVLTGAKTLPVPSALRFAALALEAVGDRQQQESKTACLEAHAKATLEITRAICSVPVLDELLKMISEHCRAVLGCELAGFALLEEESRTIVWRAMCGCRTDTYRRVTFTPASGVAGRAISSNSPIVVYDFLDDGIDPAEFPISFAEGLRSVLAVPLEIDKRARGCLMIGYRDIHEFTEQELSSLLSFSLQAAIAVENAQLYDRLRREQAQLESVAQSMNEGLIFVDLSDRIVYANRRAASLLRWPAAVSVEMTCDEFFSSIAAQTANCAQTHLDLAGLRDATTTFPSVDIELPAFGPVHLRITYFAVYKGDGERLGYGYICRDITFEKQVDSMKTDVISLVSHELKTPLASIRGYASALLDGTRKRNRALEIDYLKIINTESTRLDELVCNLTDVSKLDAGVLFLEKHEISPAYLVRSVVARWQRAQPQRRFHVSCDERITPISMDHQRIAQVLDNILSNAAKYSKIGSDILIELSADSDSVIFAVTDRGIGIAADQRERVFDRFYRIRSSSEQPDGTGLGLFICRGIIAAHGGEISVESCVGQGAMVVFSLPKNLACTR